MKVYKDLKDENVLRLFRPEMNMKRFKKSAKRLSLPVNLVIFIISFIYVFVCQVF